MSKRVFTLGCAILLSGACTPRGEFGDLGCRDVVKSCRVVQSSFNGYQRACVTSCAAFAASEDGADAKEEDGTDDAVEDAAVAIRTAAESESLPSPNLGAAHAPDSTRYSAFESPCVRDSQCGPGKCMSGNCYYGCQSDAQCGSGDRCSVESGVRVCQPDPNPPVACTRSAQCEEGDACLNGGCRQTCTSTEQCTNLLDRCASGFCLPDRRPLGECVVNSECEAGLVCLDGACVAACPAEADGGVCLAEPSAPPIESVPEDQTPSELPTATEPELPAADESQAVPSGDAPVATDESATPAPDDSDESVADEGGESDVETTVDAESPDEEAGEPASEGTSPDPSAPIPLAG